MRHGRGSGVDDHRRLRATRAPHLPSSVGTCPEGRADPSPDGLARRYQIDRPRVRILARHNHPGRVQAVLGVPLNVARGGLR